MNYAETIEHIATRLSNYFENVYHSAEIITTSDQKKLPVIEAGDQWVDLSPTDQRETVYIRRNGDDSVAFQQSIGSCVKAYKMRTPLRIVYFQDHAKSHYEILYKLMQSVLTQHTTLSRVIRDKFRLAKEESSGDYSMGASTAYFAIDIDVLWDLLPDNCENDFCVTLDNPIKQCS